MAFMIGRVTVALLRLRLSESLARERPAAGLAVGPVGLTSVHWHSLPRAPPVNSVPNLKFCWAAGQPQVPGPDPTCQCRRGRSVSHGD